MPPPEKPRPKPKPKPPKPRPKLKTTEPAEAKSMPARPAPEPERDGTPVPFPFSCETYRLCPPPPGPPATVHLRSGRLPTPLIAVSAALLAVSALLLLALLVRYLVRRQRRRQYATQQQEAAPLDDDEESVLGVDTTAWGAEEQEEEVDSGDVHHVWFIRTKGLDERAIAAIAAVVYDAKSNKRGGADDGGCAVCLAEFRDGETLRLLPRCGHAFHRGCIDTWLRAHVNCPLCRAPVQVSTSTTKSSTAAATATRARGEEDPEAVSERAEEAERRGAVVHERAVRRAASMVTVPRRAWPDVVAVQAPASSSGREEDMATGLAKIRRLLKFSEAWDVAGGVFGAGRSASFGAGSCQRFPTTARSGPSTAAAGGNGGEIESSR